eukprot:6492139-Amphidinium_carterae.3
MLCSTGAHALFDLLAAIRLEHSKIKNFRADFAMGSMDGRSSVGGSSSRGQSGQSTAFKRRRSVSSLDNIVQGTIDGMVTEALDELIGLLKAEPAKIYPCLRLARRSNCEVTKAADDATREPPFHESYKKLYRLPKDFATTYLLQLLEAPEWLTANVLRQLEKSDAGASKEIFFFIHAVRPDSPWPKFCLSRTTFRQAFRELNEYLPKRSLADIDIEYSENRIPMRVNWQKFGCFVLHPLSSFPKTHAYHCSGVSAPLESFPTINNFNYSIRENWLDEKAELVSGNCCARLLDFFPAEAKTEILDSLRVGEFLQTAANRAHQQQVFGEMVVEGQPALGHVERASSSVGTVASTSTSPVSTPERPTNPMLAVALAGPPPPPPALEDMSSA